MRRALVGVVMALGSVACGSEDADAPPTTATPSPTFTGDGSPFCDAMLGIGQVGSDAAATPEQVLAETQVLVGLLDEAQANTPPDAPPDLDGLIDDYRAASEALAAAGGDRDAAFAALQRDAPDVAERLASSASHADAYAFLVDRCGIVAP